VLTGIMIFDDGHSEFLLDRNIEYCISPEVGDV
jgi:hypothetical protein